MTAPHTVLVEVLTAAGCGHCQKAKALARGVIRESGDASIRYREINVVDEIDYAVKLGVTRTPAIAINGELVFPTLPTREKLRHAILARILHEG